MTVTEINKLIQELPSEERGKISEEWKDIEGFEGRYQISSLGRVKSLPKIIGRPDSKTNKLSKERILKCNFDLSKNKKAYAKVSLGRSNTQLVHKLVANAFIENPENKPTINHIDGNKFNNSIFNLEWATYKENNNHAYLLGLNKPQLQNLKPRKSKKLETDFSFLINNVNHARLNTHL